MAEVIKHYIPKLVDLHNYSQAHSVAQKVTNWNTLSLKVFKKIGFSLSKQEVDALVHLAPDAVERMLLNLKNCIENLPSKLPTSGVPASKPRNPAASRENMMHLGNLGGPQQAFDPEVILEKDH